MSTSTTGTTKKTAFTQQEQLAPLPLLTGRKPVDMWNTIWHKNEVFLDIGNYNIGSAPLVLWPTLLFMAFLSWLTPDPIMWTFAALMVGIPWFMVIQSLMRPTPLPVRFNRQRREVCVPRKNGKYWIVPWEKVRAIATECSTYSQGGKNTMGSLSIVFDNPDPNAEEEGRISGLEFSCGSIDGAKSLWECTRSYMEIGPDSVSDETARFHRPKGIWGTYIDDMKQLAKRKGWFMTLLWDGFFGLFIFNSLLGDVFERMKLNPPPEPLSSGQNLCRLSNGLNAL